jgi:hypothetical protein
MDSISRDMWPACLDSGVQVLLERAFDHLADYDEAAPSTLDVELGRSLVRSALAIRDVMTHLEIHEGIVLNESNLQVARAPLLDELPINRVDLCTIAHEALAKLGIRNVGELKACQIVTVATELVGYESAFRQVMALRNADWYRVQLRRDPHTNGPYAPPEDVTVSDSPAIEPTANCRI